MIDLHSHILPGVDDGPETVAESLANARAAVADGVTVLAARPHVREDYPTSPEAMHEGLDELRDALREARIPLELRGGGEIALDKLSTRPPDDLRSFTLGGDSNSLLLEFPKSACPRRRL